MESQAQVSLATQIWNGSDGNATKAFYQQLFEHGLKGEMAVALFRANKCSTRAKVYRGGIRGKGSYKSMAYERKEWSLRVLCDLLVKNAEELGITWGWLEDPNQEYHSWVVYVELPNGHGQVSFHVRQRGVGPDYHSQWDGMRLSAERICAFCDEVLNGR